MAHDNEILVEKIRGGFSVAENMQSLYEGNLPLIKKFIKPYTAYECEADLLQESYFGLWEAVQHYETSKNVQFMIYARYWIVQSVQRYLENCGSAVRIPTHTKAKISRLRKATSQLRQGTGQGADSGRHSGFIGRISGRSAGDTRLYARGSQFRHPPIAEDNSLTLADTLQANLSVENDTVNKKL